jgi:hypothetical protein
VQQSHRLPVAAPHRDGEGRASPGVAGFEVRAQVDQGLERAVVAAGAEQAAHEAVRGRDHVMQRRPLLLEAR